MSTSLSHPFGTPVRVLGETIRVTGTLEAGAAHFNQTGSSDRYRDWTNYLRDYDAHRALQFSHEWPGVPIGLDWVEAAIGFDVEPDLTNLGEALAFARLRRMRVEPTQGLVVGATWRAEGAIVPAFKGESRTLGGITRTVTLTEVAIPSPSGRVVLILTHPNDLETIEP